MVLTQRVQKYLPTFQRQNAQVQKEILGAANHCEMHGAMAVGKHVGMDCVPACRCLRASRRGESLRHMALRVHCHLGGGGVGANAIAS